MRWLTDAPDQTGSFLPDGLTWRSPTEPLSEPDRAAWFLMSASRPVWCAENADSARLWADRCCVLINHAEQSQFTVLSEALKMGGDVPDGLVCLALTGQRFHGQRQRAWSAVRGNLHLTVHYRINQPADGVQAGLAMAPAVAVSQAIQTLSQARLEPVIKWTNDVLLRGRKVAGVLTSTQIEGRRLQHVLFGVGLNIDAVPDLPPSPLAPPPGALADFEPAFRGSLPRVLHDVLRALDEAVALLRRGRVDVLFAEYRRRATFIGRKVSIWPDSDSVGSAGTPLVRGRVLELLPDLSLRLEGCPEPVFSGRMVLEEEGGWKGLS